MIKGLCALILTTFCSVCSAAEYEPRAANPSEVRLVPVQPTPQAENIEVFISFPEDQRIVRKTPIEVQLRLDGYPIGNESDFARKKEIYNDRQGQSVRVFIDDEPYFSIFESFIDTLDDNNIYYEQLLTKNIPFSLKAGTHVIRAFPVRSYGESLKDTGCFKASIFYFQNQNSNVFDVDLNQPFITYNEPQGKYPYKLNRPLLLDFYVTNLVLSKDGYKVRFTIDGQNQRILTDWVPYYIYGLRQGTHTFRLELLDPQNKKVPGIFNDVEKQVVLY